MTSQQGGARQPAGIRDVARLAGVSVETSDDLAALHRELAANVPWDVTVMEGTAADRNVELRVVPPFPLKRLPGV